MKEGCVSRELAKGASAERRGAMRPHVQCATPWCGHHGRAGRFTSSIKRLLGNHARKRDGMCQNKKLMRKGEAQVLVSPWMGKRTCSKNMHGETGEKVRKADSEPPSKGLQNGLRPRSAEPGCQT